MYRIVSFVVIFVFVSLLLVFHQQNSHFASGHHAGHEEEIIHIPSEETIPAITGAVHQDLAGSWYVHIEVDHFTFTLEKAGDETILFNEGHAHLYVNGEKINRLYGEYYNLDYLSPGNYNVKVTLHANNHGQFYYDGEPILFEQTFVVE